jgi:pimeloyl-ACP methyl ester carboxylesterase
MNIFEIILAIGGLVVVLILIDFIVSYKKYQKDIFFWENRLKNNKTEKIETQYGTIEYLRMGKGTPILVSHGIIGGFDQGLWIAKSCLGKNYHVIAVSRFGYLGSTLPKNSTPTCQADAYVELLKHLGIKKIYICGNSAGGTSAIQFALRHPDRCSGLILISSNVPSKKTLPPRSVIKAVYGSNYLYWKTIKLFGRHMLSMFVPEKIKSQLSRDELDRVQNSIFYSGLPIDKRTAGCINDIYISNPDIDKGYHFADIKAPTLIIHAVDDPSPPYEGAKKMSKEIPGAKLISFNEGGHLLLNHESEIKKEIRSFIGRLKKN